MIYEIGSVDVGLDGEKQDLDSKLHWYFGIANYY